MLPPYVHANNGAAMKSNVSARQICIALIAMCFVSSHASAQDFTVNYNCNRQGEDIRLSLDVTIGMTNGRWIFRTRFPYIESAWGENLCIRTDSCFLEGRKIKRSYTTSGGISTEYIFDSTRRVLHINSIDYTNPEVPDGMVTMSAYNCTPT